MNVLTYNPDVMTKYTVIPLGRACECRATRIEFVVSSWLSRFPGGEIALYIKDPNGEMYLGDVRTADGVASWVLRESDTKVPGYGSLELALIGANGEKKLSAVATTKLEMSLVDSETDAEYMQPWIERAAEIQADTETAAHAAATHAAVASTGASNAVEAQHAAEDARDAAEAAQEAADGAAQGAEESAKEASAAADAAAGHAADAADSAQGADAAERAAQEAAQAADDNANEAYISAEEALTHSQAAQKAAANAAQEAAEGVRQSVAEDAEKAQQAAERAETSAKDARDVLDSIPEDYTVLMEQVEKNRLDITTKAPAIVQELSGGLVTLNDAAASPAVSLVSKLAAVQSGTGDPSPDNIRPISGWDTVTLTRAGKNLIDIQEVTTTRYDVAIAASGNRITMNGTSSAATSGIAMLHRMPIKAGRYMLSGAVTGSLSAIDGTSTVILRASRDIGGVVDMIEVRLRHNTVSQISLVVPYDGYAIVQVMLANNSAVYDAYTIDIQLEAGDTATPFEPCTRQMLTAALPETVYGGTLDWTTGLLTVTQEGILLDGTEVWGVKNEGTPMRYYYTSVGKNGYVVNDSGACSHYPTRVITSGDVNIGVRVVNMTYEDASIVLRPDRTVIATVPDLQAYLAEQSAAGTPVTVVYELASPRTIQLTPQQLELLKGCNTVWSDTGDTEVSYIADTKSYIDNAIAAIAASIIDA